MAEKNNRHVGQRRRRGPGPGGPGGHGMMPGEKATDFGGTMKKLLRYLRPHSFKLAVVFIFAIVSTVFSIVSPTILGDATDTICGRAYVSSWHRFQCTARHHNTSDLPIRNQLCIFIFTKLYNGRCISESHIRA